MDAEWRISAGNRVNGALAALMRRRNFTSAVRLTIHNAVLVPTLLYGSETWVLQNKYERCMPWRCDVFVGYAEDQLS